MEMRTYSCTLVSRKNPKHELVLECVTKQELQLLAFIHGGEQLPADKIKALGMRPVVMGVDAESKPIYVKSEMDEYTRLAMKYETRVNPGKGKKYVEDCFKIALGGFDNIIAEVDAMAAIEAATAEADRVEAAGIVQAGASARQEIERQHQESVDPAPPPAAPPPTIGARLAAAAVAERE